MSYPSTFEPSLIGLDKANTINAYYQRDLNLNLNNANTIAQCLTKLGYHQLNVNITEEVFIKSKIISWIKNNPYSNFPNVMLVDIINDIRNSTEYLQFADRLNHRIARYNELGNFTNSSDIYAFYSALTLDELNHLGY